MDEPLRRAERAGIVKIGPREGWIWFDEPRANEYFRRYEATLKRAEAALREIEMKPYRAEEVIRRYREEAGDG